MAEPRTIDVLGLDGKTSIRILASAVWRLRAALPTAEAPDAVRVDHTGGYLLTRDSLDALIGRLAAKGVTLVAFTGPEEQPVHLARTVVVGFRPADANRDPSHARTVLILSAGSRMQAVREDEATVRQRLAPPP